jgi:formylglycine-generating enzyme required for sulfatase activity
MANGFILIKQVSVLKIFQNKNKTMKKSILLMILIIVFVCVQAQNCYDIYRNKGVAAYNAGDYAKAKEYFAGALSVCVSSEVPANNDINSWLKKCDDAIVAAEKERQRQEQIARELNIEMVFVQGGTFTMGCTPEQGDDCWSWEKPTHEVTLSDFNIGKYEVTQAQWKAIKGDNPSINKGDNLPVEEVSWDDVQEFLRKLNQKTGKQYRLPTEAEWEYAARGGSKSRGYKYSGSNTLSEVAWFGDNSGYKTHPVGGKKANELGIYDMSGNVWEWCSDWYGNYGSGSQMNPKGQSSGSDRMFRGGSCGRSVGYCRVAYRLYDSPGFRYALLGFRVVLP